MAVPLVWEHRYSCLYSYVENVITESELAATQPRIQERIKQVAARNAAGLVGGGGGQWNGFYSSPAPTPLNRLKRVGMYTTDALLSPIDCFLRQIGSVKHISLTK